MAKLFRRMTKKAGAAPGTLVHVGEVSPEQIRLAVAEYATDRVHEWVAEDVAETFALRHRPNTSWIDVTGIHDVRLIERLGRHFGIHPLTLEDLVNTHQRPKLEEYDTYLFIVLKMLHYDHDAGEVRTEQVSIVLTDTCLISFQETPGDVFEPVRERIRRGRGRIRQSGSGYLAYALVDAIVDHYFVILEKIGARIEALEEDLLDTPGADTLETIHFLKRETILLRKQIWPLRELISGLLKTDAPLVNDDMRVFLRDVYDHTIQVIDTLESFRDVLSGMTDLYLSTLSHRMNAVMKVLTIIATIFIPVTFVAGIYGMNFEHMPELGWRWGYAAFWGVVAVIAAVMIVVFKRCKWI